MTLKAISLFTGIGGLDFGFEAAGFETAVALEFDRFSCNTIRANRSWPLIEGDILETPSEKILELGGVSVGEADVLIGGPPCQPFSKSSYWVRGDSLRLDDPRAGTLAGYLRVLRDTQPKAFLLENVAGIAFSKKDEGLNFILDGVKQINREVGTNYSVTWKVIRSADYGVPQQRERVFLIGSREGVQFNFPAPTHRSANTEQETDLFHNELEPYRTAWDALGDLPDIDPMEPSVRVGGKWADLLPSIPEGQNYLWHTNRGGGRKLFGWRTRYWSFLLKLSKRLPSWTIQAQPGSSIGPFHWSSRKLTFEELCRIQTFPDGLVTECSRTEMQRQLGNAVPSLVAEILAREIRSQILGDNKLTRRPLLLLPPRRTPVPPAVKPRAVPKKYHSLIGDHDDHPGEGKSAGAKQRK